MSAPEWSGMVTDREFFAEAQRRIAAVATEIQDSGFEMVVENKTSTDAGLDKITLAGKLEVARTILSDLNEYLEWEVFGRKMGWL
jgi:hypothetical protein